MMLLNKVLAREFYRLNSGFFLLVGTLTFGFMSGVEHKALGQYFVSSGRLLLLPIGVWAVYCFKIISFNHHQLGLEENRILFNIPFLSRARQYSYIGVCFYIQFLPALAYGLFLLAIAWSSSFYENMAIILGALIACMIVSTWLVTRSFHTACREAHVCGLKKWMDQHYQKPLLQFYTEWLLRRDPLLLIGTKVFACALIFGACSVYGPERYDWRLISMASSGCSLANLFLIYKLRDFEQQHISWIKNLPINTPARFITLVAVLAVVLIPEFAILVKYFPTQLEYYWLATNIFYLLGVSAFLTGFLHVRSAPLEYYTKRSFWVFIALIIAILFKVSPVILGVVNFGVGFFLFQRNYYKFEPYRQPPART